MALPDLSLPVPAVEFARLAEAAYDPAIPPTFVAGANEVYVTLLPTGAIVVTCRGSSDLADWWVDLKSLPGYAPDLKCYVHAGFLEAAHQVWPVLKFWLDATPGPIWLCGHSKGAAEATVLAALMVRWGRPPAGLVTFGSPRVGFSGLSWWLRGIPVWLFVHGADRITRVPFLLGWRPICPPIVIGRPGHPLADHLIPRYIAALSKEAPVPENTSHSKPWFMSKGVIGGAVAVAAAAAQLAGIDPSPLLDLLGVDPASVTPAAVLSSLGLSGGALAIIGRVYATTVLTAQAVRRSNAAGALSLLAGPALAGAVILSAVAPLGACSTGVVMPGPIADLTARSPLHQVASGRANLNAVLAAAAVYVQSGQATGKLTETVRDLSVSAAAAVDRADAVATAGASQTVVTVILSAAHRDLREMTAAMAKEVRGQVLSLIATASVERGLDLGSNLAIGATAAAHTRLTAWESEARDPTPAELAALSAETASLLAIIRGE